MTSIREAIRRLLETTQPLPPGNYHYQSPLSDPDNYRLHLRLEPDGSGVLVVNAATVLHLNQTAAEYAFYLVQNIPADQVARNMKRRYQVSYGEARQDYQDLKDRIETLITTPDLDPVVYLGFDRQEPFSGDISAPYRLDCALTYRTTGDQAPVEALSKRVAQELSTVEWKEVLTKAWEAGIPHVVFTGGEPTLRPDLADLLAFAETNGQVTGLITDGLRLAEAGYLDQLLLTGLDHAMLVLDPDQEQAWSALDRCVAADLFLAAHLTLRPENAGQIETLLHRLTGLGLKAVSLSASSEGLAGPLQAARELAADLNLELIWNLPVPYSTHNPVSLETEAQEHPEGAGRGWLYVEPDGDVLPAQGINRPLGSLLRQPWPEIWQGEALARFREEQ